MMIRHRGPDTNIPVHSHPYHEMFYVLEGEIEIGGTTYMAGSCIYVEKVRPMVRRGHPKGRQSAKVRGSQPGQIEPKGISKSKTSRSSILVRKGPP